MGKRCPICKNSTIFYIWSTSRNFDKDKYLNIKRKLHKADTVQLNEEGEPICMVCVEKYGLIK